MRLVDHDAIQGLNSSAGCPNATELLLCHSDQHLMLAALVRKLCSCCHSVNLPSCMERGVRGLMKNVGAAWEGSKTVDPLPVLTQAPHVGIPLPTPAPFSRHHTLLMLHQICQQLKHTCQLCLTTCISANRRSHRHGSPNSVTMVLTCCTRTMLCVQRSKTIAG